jgi:uncharacterized membrane protein
MGTSVDATFAISFLHVMLGTMWMGGSLFGTFVTAPVIAAVVGKAVPTPSAAFGDRAANFFRTTGGLAILMGVIIAWLGGRLTLMVVNFSHVLLISLWIGGAIFATAVAVPALRTIQGDAAVPIADFTRRAARFFRITGLLAIALAAIFVGADGRLGPIGWIAIAVGIGFFIWGESTMARRAAAIAGAGARDRPGAMRAALQDSAIENLGYLVLLLTIVTLR